MYLSKFSVTHLIVSFSYTYDFIMKNSTPPLLTKSIKPWQISCFLTGFWYKNNMNFDCHNLNVKASNPVLYMSYWRFIFAYQMSRTNINHVCCSFDLFFWFQLFWKLNYFLSKFFLSLHQFKFKDHNFKKFTLHVFLPTLTVRSANYNTCQYTIFFKAKQPWYCCFSILNEIYTK